MVSVDATWHRCGLSSENVLSVNGPNSKVIDTVTLSNYCDARAKSKQKLCEEEFQHWFLQHTAEEKC